MGTEIGTLRNTGSRDVDIQINRYFGGKKKGMCVQLTAEMENGDHGYVQLSVEDLIGLIPILQRHLVNFSAGKSRRDEFPVLYPQNFEKSDELIEENSQSSITIDDIVVIFASMTKELNLCDYCTHAFATCNPEGIIFGNGPGNDNVVRCTDYEREEIE